MCRSNLKLAIADESKAGETYSSPGLLEVQRCGVQSQVLPGRVQGKPLACWELFIVSGDGDVVRELVGVKFASVEFCEDCGFRPHVYPIVKTNINLRGD